MFETILLLLIIFLFVLTYILYKHQKNIENQVISSVAKIQLMTHQFNRIVKFQKSLFAAVRKMKIDLEKKGR